MNEIFPNKCNNCGEWTIWELTHQTMQATIRCTHCGNVGVVKNKSIRHIKDLLSQARRAHKKLIPDYPELAALRSPGDHVPLR